MPFGKIPWKRASVFWGGMTLHWGKTMLYFLRFPRPARIQTRMFFLVKIGNGSFVYKLTWRPKIMADRRLVLLWALSKWSDVEVRLFYYTGTRQDHINPWMISNPTNLVTVSFFIFSQAECSVKTGRKACQV